MRRRDEYQEETRPKRDEDDARDPDAVVDGHSIDAEPDEEQSLRELQQRAQVRRDLEEAPSDERRVVEMPETEPIPLGQHRVCVQVSANMGLDEEPDGSRGEGEDQTREPEDVDADCGRGRGEGLGKRAY